MLKVTGSHEKEETTGVYLLWVDKRVIDMVSSPSSAGIQEAFGCMCLAGLADEKQDQLVRITSDRATKQQK